MEAPKTVKKNWYRLDNSAKIYPAVMSRNWASMFRVSLTLKEPVDPAVLQAALEDTVRRIPTFCLSLHRGLFWYYLNASRQRPLVEPDVANPCKKMEKGENGGYCFRVRYYRCRIAVELFHSIADGTGAMIFLKTLAGRYLQLRGYDVVPDGEMLDCSQEPTEDEMEDSHSKYAQFRHIESRREEAAAQKAELIRQLESAEPIVLKPLPPEREKLVTAADLTIRYAQRSLFEIV